ncbi:hypothetical protein PUR59_01555 [Streptomyces sp. SP18ES09]|uniref:hypothetical protein n=1 Tax=Streptomyces sp. SP18ES09 TaxID=3002532 RepID=UPI002E7995F5|nr:hypothetical protein [Streptomyces sp. SP18ES09]MEE1813727.1 hypothetical protein [Streptomyces sp. SP18ES09]
MGLFSRKPLDPKFVTENVAAADKADPNVTRAVPAHTVTWPVAPSGIRTVLVEGARSPQDAVTRALRDRKHIERTTTRGYRVLFESTPEVWLIDSTGARHVTGPYLGA